VNSQTENPDTFSNDPLTDLKQDALNMVGNCIECGSCYIDCAFSNYGDDPEQCRQWIRQSNDFLSGKIKTVDRGLVEANFRCAECNRCHHSCPESIYRRHGNMMMKHMIANPMKHRVNIHPYSNYQVKQAAIEKFVLSKWKEEEKQWYFERLNEFKQADVLLYHGCYVYLQAAQCMKLEKMLGAAGVSYVSVGKLEYCCGTFGFYRGHSDMDKIKPGLVEMVDRVRPKRIISNCGHCLNAMLDLINNSESSSRPDIRHCAEELLELSIEKKLDLAYLETTFAIHDSCNLRSLHDQQGPLRKLIRRVGMIHEMMSHGKSSRCCGDVSRYYDKKHIDEINRQVKVREFVSSGADEMITACAGCYENYHTNPQLHTVDLIDVIYRAFAKARAEDMELERENSNICWENMCPIGSEV